MTAEELKAILQKWDEDAKEAVEENGVAISAEGIVINHTDIENRAGLSLAGMSVADALAELDEPDDGQKSLYFRESG